MGQIIIEMELRFQLDPTFILREYFPKRTIIIVVFLTNILIPSLKKEQKKIFKIEQIYLNQLLMKLSKKDQLRLEIQNELKRCDKFDRSFK